MAENVVALNTPDPAVAESNERLRHFAKIKALRDETRKYIKQIEAEFDGLQQQIVEEWDQLGKVGDKLDIGSFWLTRRTFGTVKDLTDLLHWAEAQDLIKNLQWQDDGTVLIPFQIMMTEDEAGEQKPSLVNGVFRAEAYKKPLMDHVTERMDEGDPEPPGLKVSRKFYVNFRKASGA